MNRDKKTISQRFNQSAASYENYAVIQKMTAQQLVNKLAKTPSPERILEIGCGTGILTQLLVNNFPQSSITALDIAPDMIKSTKAKLGSRINYIIHDIETIDWQNIKPFDLIISNAVFQWLRHLETTIPRLVKILKPRGLIVASTYGPQTFKELNSLFRDTEKQLGLAQQNHHLPLKTISYWEDVFFNAGLQEIETEEAIHQLSYPNCREFLNSIKAIGANYSENNHSLLTTRKLLVEVIKQYDCKYKRENGVYTTYQVIKIRGRKN